MALKGFEDYIHDGVVRKVSRNTERAKSLIDESERKFASLKEKIEKIGIRDDNANDYVENCYDIIMRLIRSKLYLEGYYSSGFGAHEAEVSYLKVLGFDENDVRFTDKLRYFRNGISYYGTCLDKEYAEKVVDFTKRIYRELKKIVGL